MNCRGCGVELDPTENQVNAAVDQVLDTPLEDAKKTGGVCPLCGHSKYTPVSHRKTVQFALLLGSVLLLSVGLLATRYYHSPLRSPLGLEAVSRARTNPEVKDALGEHIRVGLLARGAIHTDETGWSEAKLNILLRGSKHNATLRVVAGKGTGPWVFSKLDVLVEGQQKRIDLLKGKLEVGPNQAYVDVHTEPAREAELPDAVVVPTPTWDGSYPVLMITPSATAHGRMRFRHSLTTYKPSLRHASPVNVFEVDLRSGMFVLRQTDLFVEDVMPLALTPPE
jgi:Cytochrome oxidase complex assembly protein 1